MRIIKSITQGINRAFNRIVVETSDQIRSGKNKKDKRTDLDHIKDNATISVIIKKTCSIISECKLVIKQDNNGKDELVKNIYINKFLEFISNPQGRPYPKKTNDIIESIISDYYYKGVGAIIFTFDVKKLKQKNEYKKNILNSFKNIKIPRNVYIENDVENKKVCYRADIDYTLEQEIFQLDKNLFKYDSQWKLYTNEDQEELMFLCLFENYDIDTRNYKSDFEDLKDYVKTQNYIIESGKKFYEDGGIAGGVMNLQYDNLRDLASYDSDKNLKSSHEKTIEELANGFEDGKKMIILNRPNIKPNYTPIQSPRNSNDSILESNMLEQKIYAMMDGGTKSAFEGLNEYSNNAILKIKELYDGTIRTANKIILENLNLFVKNFFNNSYIVDSDVKNIYFQFDISAVKIFQDAKIIEIKELWKEGILKQSEARNLIGSISDDYSGLENNELEQRYYFDLKNKAIVDKQVLVNENQQTNN